MQMNHPFYLGPISGPYTVTREIAQWARPATQEPSLYTPVIQRPSLLAVMPSVLLWRKGVTEGQIVQMAAMKYFATDW